MSRELLKQVVEHSVAFVAVVCAPANIMELEATLDRLQAQRADGGAGPTA